MEQFQCTTSGGPIINISKVMNLGSYICERESSSLAGTMYGAFEKYERK